MKNSARLDCSAAFNVASAARRSASTGDWAFRRVVVNESAIVARGVVFLWLFLVRRGVDNTMYVDSTDSSVDGTNAIRTEVYHIL